MVMLLVVTVDTNDADYVTSVTEISPEELAQLRPLFEAIKNFESYEAETENGWHRTHDYNYPYGECLRRDQGEKDVRELYPHIPTEVIGLFEDKFLPPVNYGLHDIESVDIYEVSSREEIIKFGRGYREWKNGHLESSSSRLVQ